MNSRAFTLSVIIAFIAMFMVYTYIEGETAKYIKEYGEKIPVVVAKVDIGELDLIDDSMVTVRPVPKAYVSPGAFQKIEEVYNTIATVSILKNEQITKPRVEYPGEKTGLSRQVSVGKRAVSINVTEDQAVSKLLKPGDRVDVIAMIDYAGGKKNLLKTKTVLQDVLVLSTGRDITNSIPVVGVRTPKEIKKMKLNVYSQFNTVALELDPFQVQKIVFLDGIGARLSLSLRNNDDKKIIRIKGTRLYDLLDEDAPEAKEYFLRSQKK